MAVHRSEGDEPVVLAIPGPVTGNPAARPTTGAAWAFLRCDDCDARRRDQASTSSSTTTFAAARVGWAADVLALAGLAPGGLDAPGVELLAEVGSEIAFSSLYWPRATAPANVVATRPWAHVSDEQHARMAQAVAGWLSTRVHASRDPQGGGVPAPAHAGGCALCGVATIPTEQSWRCLLASSTSLGGSPSPDLVRGAACPTCARVLDAVGAVGRSALERAYTEHLEREGRMAEASLVRIDGLPGLRGWAATTRTKAKPKPNPSPWAHVAPLDLAGGA